VLGMSGAARVGGGVDSHTTSRRRGGRKKPCWAKSSMSVGTGVRGGGRGDAVREVVRARRCCRARRRGGRRDEVEDKTRWKRRPLATAAARARGW
jgi:hypothetical protein